MKSARAVRPTVFTAPGGSRSVIDGVLLLSLHYSDPLPDLLESRGLPTVIAPRPADGDGYYVDDDNVGVPRAIVV